VTLPKMLTAWARHYAGQRRFAVAELARTAHQASIMYRQDPGGGWELASGRPHPALRHIVREYEGYREAMPQPLRRREIPSASIPVIINFGPPYRLLDPAAPDDPARAVEQRSGFVAGLDDTFALTESTGAAHCVQLNLDPLAAYRLFARPMSDLTRQVVALEDLLGAGATLLTEELASEPTWEGRYAILDTMLAARLVAMPAPMPEIAWAWRQLVRSGGKISVTMLSGELGWSPKRLIAHFREQIGLPPKQSARLLRFQHAVVRLGAGTVPDWSAFAVECGFYDQSHLIAEFRQFAGETPAGLLRRRLPAAGGFAG
jgi:AraC-like DNA-binding protein